MLARFSIRDAESQLSRLIAMAEAGEEVVIVRDGEPVARLVPTGSAVPQRRFGALASRISIGEGFFEPLPTDELSRWGQ